MRRVHAQVLAAVIGALAAATIGCGGANEEAAPATPPPPPEPVAQTDMGPQSGEPVEATPPPPPEVPASYVAAQSAEAAQVDKLVELLKDEKAACGKVADSLTKFAKDPDGLKTVQTFHEERAKLTDEQRVEADKKAAPEDVQAKVDGAGPVVEKCKKDKKFTAALTKALSTFSPSADAPSDANAKTEPAKK